MKYMDLPTLNAVLRVNGHSGESAPETIRSVLLACGYAEDEVASALAILHGEPDPVSRPAKTPGAYVKPILEHTRSIPHAVGIAPLYGARIGVMQFWLATACLAVVSGALFLAAEVTFLPLSMIGTGLSIMRPPYLAAASAADFAILGAQALILLAPVLFFLPSLIGLQVRRLHDFGISGRDWLAIAGTLAVLSYIAAQTPFAVFLPFLLAAVAAGLFSWPGASDENGYGNLVRYPSLAAAIRGSEAPEGNLAYLCFHLLVPLVCAEVICVALSFLIERLPSLLGSF